jgi:type VI secretion system secreted protein VgrG
VLFHGNLETLGPKNRPHPSAEHKITIAEPKTPEEPRQLVFSLQSHAGRGRPLANVPYALYKGESKVEDGITDDMGQIAIEHDGAASAYRVELPNGETYSLPVVPKLALTGDAAHSEHKLSNVGARALDGSTESREHG